MPTLAKKDAFPDLIVGPKNGPGWTVLECATIDSASAPEKRILAVPKARTYYETLARMHELRHVVECQAEGNDISGYGPEPRGSFRRMVEEIVLELNSPMDIRQARDGLDWDHMPAPEGRLANACMVLQLINSFEASGNDKLRAFYMRAAGSLDHPDQMFLYRCYNSLQMDRSIRNRDTWADALTKHFGLPRVETSPSRVDPAEAEKRKAADREEQNEEEELEAGRDKHGQLDKNDSLRKYTGEDKLTIHYHVGGRTPSRNIKSQWRRTDIAGQFRFPSQVMVPNGKPFARKGRGGTLIIDVSGSMSWTSKQIEDAMQTLPSLTVGLYGSETDGARGDCRLCVVGQNGHVGDWKRDEEPHAMHGNGRSDHQAILAMMKIGRAPYVWVSDGGVFYADIRDTIQEMMDQGKLVRTGTIQQAIDYMHNRRTAIFSRSVLD